MPRRNPWAMYPSDHPFVTPVRSHTRSRERLHQRTPVAISTTAGRVATHQVNYGQVYVGEMLIRTYMVDVKRITAVIPTGKWGIFIGLGILAPAAMAIGFGGTTEEMIWIFVGCFLVALVLLSEFIKDG